MSSKRRTKRSQGLPDESNGADEPNPKRLKSSEENPGPYADRLAGFIPNEASAPVGVPLSWRLDPGTSFSDWTIVIEEEDGTSTTTYHVHKCVLASGQRKSDYFSNACRTRLAESLSSTSNISLDRLSAAAFPVMLDYIYEPQRPFFTVENAVALRYLANYFLVPSLFEDVTCYIEGRLNFEDDNDFNDLSVPPTFLKQAALFRDEILISAAVDACAAVIQSISSSDLISTGMPLFIKISTSSKLNCPSKAMSKIVAEVCHHYAGEMDWATLKALTSEEIIPEFDADASLVLLKACESTLCNDTAAASDSESLHALRNRCMDAIVLKWKGTILAPLSSVSDKTNDLPHRQLPPPTQVALLEKALCQAGTEVAQLQVALWSLIALFSVYALHP